MKQQITPLAAIHDEACISLITFRKNGNAVATPVWFAQDQGNGLLYVETTVDAGKLKRIRRNPHVTLTPCTFFGRTYGETYEGRAYIVRTVQEIYIARGALHRKYGWRRQFIYSLQDAVNILRRKPVEQLAYIAIEPQR